jgi:hypothetical protein
MDSPVASPVSAPTFTAALPSWALPRGREPDDLGAAFAAGIALKSLNDLVRSAPPGPAAGARVRPSNVPRSRSG